MVTREQVPGFLLAIGLTCLTTLAFDAHVETCADALLGWWLSGCLHECAHLLLAVLFGFQNALTKANAWGIVLRHSCKVPGISGYQEAVVRHAGWIFSAVLFLGLLTCGEVQHGLLLGVGITAVDAVLSDLLGMTPFQVVEHTFYCGNFGLLLLGLANKDKVLVILQRMIEITMMRGAQSGGVVTYVPRAGLGAAGLRCRVVNGKRTNLAELVYKKMKKTHPAITAEQGPRLYCGHTRFATSSLVTMDGCHPHQWAPPQTLEVWEGFRDGNFVSAKRNVENFICHNGDFDAWKVGSRTYDVGAIQVWLERVLGVPKPSVVDSAAIAGVIDLLRTQGVWFLSVRYAFLFCVPHSDLDYDIPAPTELQSVADIFNKAFTQQVQGAILDLSSLRQNVINEVTETLQRMEKSVLGLDEETGTLGPFVQGAVDAFFDNDLLQTVRTFLGGAKGSFGLCVSSSLDSHRQFVLAARGQTISIAFYPQLQLILYGSEQAAVQAAQQTSPEDMDCTVIGTSWGQLASRLDLDDLGGEICLLDWGDGLPSVSRNAPAQSESVDMQGFKVTVTLVHESHLLRPRFESRLVPLEKNPLILPLPAPQKDLVGHDINEIPKVLKQIQDSFSKVEGLNRITAATFVRKLEQRLRKSAGRLSSLKPSNEVDILITGCEVSLWVGEQFASDLSLLFPELSVRVVSANKLLALKGQLLPHGSTGHFANQHWDLTDSLAIICSHSGGTFAPLAVSNLLQPLTNNIFLITSQWDTQVGKQLRQSQWFPCIFSTNVGLRPAEPCSLTVVAMHHLLTGLLLFMMKHIHEKKLSQMVGATYTEMDIHQLEVNAAGAIAAVEDIVGRDTAMVARPTETSKELRARGHHWATHVLEAPICWIITAIYILVTVGLGYPLVTGIAVAAGIPSNGWMYFVQFADAIIYILMPQWTAFLLRFLQRRPILHRISCRTVVIGDVPWVAQSAEAFLSKLFAVTYNNTSVYVYSGNPADHLVHRFTHRVVRGVLLACGRPDGRLSALTAIENSVCLSINQASSIQNFNTTCESLTIGHNPFKLPLTKFAVYLKGNRKEYLCERVLKEHHGKDILKGKSSAALTELYSDLFHGESEGEGHNGHQSGHQAFAPGLASPTFNLFKKSKEDTLKVQTLRAMAGETMREEKYFGEFVRKDHPDVPLPQLLQGQHLSMQLYESRVASMERLVAFFIMFHEMGYRVQQFWKYISLGILKYDMHRSQSIMRIATTASPVSGAEVRGQMLARAAEKQVARARRLLRMAVIRWKLAQRLRGNAKPTSKLIYARSSTPDSESQYSVDTTQNLNELQPVLPYPTPMDVRFNTWDPPVSPSASFYEPSATAIY